MGYKDVNVVVGGYSHDGTHPQTYKTVILKAGIPLGDQFIYEDTIYVVKWDFEIGMNKIYSDLDLTTGGTMTIDGTTYYWSILAPEEDVIINLSDNTVFFCENGSDVLIPERSMTVVAGIGIRVASPLNTYHEKAYYTEENGILVPDNCILKFDGGSISNGDIYFPDFCVVENGIFNECSIRLGNNCTLNKCEVQGDQKLYLIAIIDVNGVTIQNSKIHTTKLRYNGRNCSPIFVKQSSCVEIKNCEVFGSAFDNRTAGGDYYDDENGDYTHSVIYCKFSNSIDIINCNLYDGANECLYLYRCDNVKVVNNEIHDSFYSAISGVFGHGNSYNGNHCHYTGASCITITDYEFAITNNIVHHNNYERTPLSTNGIVAGHSSNPSPTGERKRMGIVSNNLVYDYNLNGIISDDVENITISSNIVIDSLGNPDGSCILVGNKDTAINAVITNNTLKNNYRGINIFARSTNTSGTFDVLIEGNVVENTTIGSTLPTCNNLKIIGNTYNDVRTGLNLNENIYAIISNNIINYRREAVNCNRCLIGIIESNYFKYVSDTTPNGTIYLSSANLLTSSFILNISNNYFYLGATDKILYVYDNDNFRAAANSILLNNNFVSTSASITGTDNLHNIQSPYVYIDFKNTRINGSVWILNRVSSEEYVPKTFSNSAIGEKCLVTDTTTERIWSGRQWIKTFGETSDRPYFEQGVLQYFIGFEYYDTSLGKPIYKTSTSSTSWVDATGTEV